MDMRTLMIIVAASSIALAGAGCGKSNETPSGTSTSATATAPSAVPASTPLAPVPSASATGSAAPSAKVDVDIASVGNTMAFDKTTLSVPTGAEVHLTLKNNGTITTMTHNWVLVKTGTEAAVALAGLEKAPDAGFVVPSPDVLAYTPLAGPKQTVEVTFTAPAPGKYPYICTFPGHYMTMKGVLTVTP
jgi:azurin